MDPCAELTLRLIRIAQEALEPNSSLVDWLILPIQQRADWREAARYLAAMTKPALVAPILEPGCLAVWSVHEGTPRMQHAFEEELRSQREFLTQRLAALCLADPGFVETPDGAFRITVSDLHRWTQEYCLHSVGIGIARSAPDTARLLVCRPGGGRPPVGWIPPAS